MLLAYNAGGEVVGTLDYLVARDATGKVLGLYDFAAHELAGGKLRDFWTYSQGQAIGSGTWPEFLGHRAHDFLVELEGKRIVRLKHLSGHVRHRERIDGAIRDAHEAAIAQIRKEAKLRKGLDVEIMAPIVDLRAIVGGPNKPLELDEDGRTRPKRDAEGTLPVHVRE